MVNSHVRFRSGKSCAPIMPEFHDRQIIFPEGIAHSLDAIGARLASRRRLLDSPLACPSYAERIAPECRSFVRGLVVISVMIELNLQKVGFDVYLDRAKTLRPQLERMNGFVEESQYKSLDRPSWILSLSTWTDETSVVGWREVESHRAAQEEGRAQLFSDYRARVGQITVDSSASEIPHEYDSPQAAASPWSKQVATIITAPRPALWPTTSNPADCAVYLNLDPYAAGLVSWDVLEDINVPGSLLLLISWKDDASAASFEQVVELREGTRLRQVRIVRDYGMLDRREAPQILPEVRLGTDCD
jgi:heme-degrading monooxygenase HmoA